MVKIRASCGIKGKSFSPKKFASLSLIPLDEAHEVGAIGLVGIYRGKPIPYGSATIQVSPKAEEEWSQFDKLLELVEASKEALSHSGAEEVYLSCSLFHDGQCNFGFSMCQLKRIAALNLDLVISCYTQDVE